MCVRMLVCRYACLHIYLYREFIFNPGISIPAHFGCIRLAIRDTRCDAIIRQKVRHNSRTHCAKQFADRARRSSVLLSKSGNTEQPMALRFWISHLSFSDIVFDIKGISSTGQKHVGHKRACACVHVHVRLDPLGCACESKDMCRYRAKPLPDLS